MPKKQSASPLILVGVLVVVAVLAFTSGRMQGLQLAPSDSTVSSSAAQSSTTSSSCTLTYTYTLTSGEAIPPLPALPLGSCYAFVYISATTSSTVVTSTTVITNTYTVVQPSSTINPTTCNLQECPSGCIYTPEGAVCATQVQTYTCSLGWAINTNGSCVQIASETTLTNTAISTGTYLGTYTCTTTWTHTGAYAPVPSGVCQYIAPTNPLLDGLAKLWDWLRCFFGYCS
jgi:hypothetical protein